MWRDQAYLLDMLTAARDARDFAAGLTRDGYEASRSQYAVSHALQIIGSAQCEGARARAGVFVTDKSQRLHVLIAREHKRLGWT